MKKYIAIACYITTHFALGTLALRWDAYLWDKVYGESDQWVVFVGVMFWPFQFVANLILVCLP